MIDKGDLYIIELKDKIKVGRSKNVKKRFRNVLSGAGILEKEVLNFFSYEDLGVNEQKILRLFKGQKINGEWFYKNGIVSFFLKEIKKNTKIDDNLLIKIQLFNYHNNVNDQLLETYEIIRNERKNIGFPSSPKIKDILKKNTITYRHTNYILSKDFLSFKREFNFDILNPNKTQCLECLKIIRNTTRDTFEKEKIQGLIDEFYNNNFSNLNVVLKLVFELSKQGWVHIDETNELTDYTEIEFKESKIKDQLSYGQLKNLKRKNVHMIDLFDNDLWFFDSSLQIQWRFENHSKIKNQLISNNIPFRNFSSDYDFDCSFNSFVKSKSKQQQIINSESLTLFYDSLMFDFKDKFCFWKFPTRDNKMVLNFLKNNNLVFDII